MSSSGTPSRSPAPVAAGSGSLLVVRLGDVRFNTLTSAPGTALSVHLDLLDVATGATLRSDPAPATDGASAASGGGACTLSFGDVTPNSTSWWLETEGLPSLAALTADAVALPCHDSPAGAPLSALLRDNKTVAVGRANRPVDTSVRFAGYVGLRGTATGLRQVATPDGREFWVAGIANSKFGVRYLEPRAGNAPGGAVRNATRVYGATFFTYRGVAHHQAASLDVRSIALVGSRLLLSSSHAVESNGVSVPQGTQDGFTPWGGIVQVGRRSKGVPRESTSEAALLRGFDGRGNFWGFLHESSESLWALKDRSTYTRARTQLATAFNAQMEPPPQPLVGAGDTRPVLLRTSVSTAVAQWEWVAYAWVARRVPGALVIPAACYTLAGRLEGAAAPVWVMYTASRDAVFRVVPSQLSVVVLAVAPPGQLFRGVALPPRAPAQPSAPATPAASPSPAASRSPTASRSSKARGRGGPA